jgi:superfamily II DNA or RNA helicase
VLLPTQKLFKTWKDEIEKHTSGFFISEQEANGSHKPIQYNTILITTLGRMRDHPIYNSWQLVVIDECLSVQNREALQTEEAWRQATISQFGVLMMSATFFRSRFDKMFFMLKMLRSGLPEIKEYLDCILGESMICFIAEKSRHWLTNVIF